MKTDSLRISKVFNIGGDVHYILPHFQREYAWEKSNWQTLLKDILSIYETYDPTQETEHFMGALMVINDGTRNGTVPAFKLVDGQQRLTTISLLLCALGRLAKDKQTTIYKKIQRLLTNPDEIDTPFYYKLLPTTKYGDRDAYIAVIQEEGLSKFSESRIPQAFEYFHRELELKINQGKLDLEKFFIVLTTCLQVVFIDLDQRERPYEIFESLNSKGKPLSQADLVRNYIAMRLPEAKQEQVFEKYWSQIESVLQEKRTVGRSRLGELTAFLRHYLAFRSGVLCNEEHVYARFRDRIETDFSTPDAFTGEIETLKRFAGYYNKLLRPKEESDLSVRAQLEKLDILEISTAYPFLLAAYDAKDRQEISKEGLLEGLQILENYIVRRYLAGEPTNYLNKMFPTLWRELNPTRFGESIRHTLTSKNYPSDNRLRQTIATEQLYDGRSQTRYKIYLVLDRINKHLSVGSGGHTVLDGEPTIEHIMPRSPDVTWKNELGENWEEIYQENLNTLGNLTLVTQEWNSQLSNAAFSIKKQKLCNHALRLNSSYFSLGIDRWDSDAIQVRAKFLSDKIIEIWPSFGEVPISQGTLGQKPRTILIISDTYEVKSWRDVAFFTAECAIQLADNFDIIAEQMPTYFFREAKKRCRQLSNGWYITTNLTGSSATSLCRNLMSLVGASEDDWQIEFD